MPQVSAEVVVDAPPRIAFAISQTTGDLRLSWDPFIRRQYFLDRAVAPAKGVRTRTHARLGPRMTSEYVSYRPPTSVAEPIGQWLLGREIRRRIDAFARACIDQRIVAAVSSPR